MKGLLSYSGITAKVRAMEGKLITNEQFKALAALESVPDAVGFLRALPSYQEIFTGLEDDALHRGTIEQLLTDSLYSDYTKLYRFSNIKQRSFLDFYFFHFETSILKNCLRNAVAHHPISLGLARYEEFFNRHSKVDLITVSASESLEEFVDNLQGTVYYGPLSKLKEAGDTDHFDYEMALDLFYFSSAWDVIRKKLPKGEQDAVLKCFGIKLDLLNLQWIYRSKRYYRISAEAADSLLIPLHYKLRPEQTAQLVSADSTDAFFAELSKTWYGSSLKEETLSEPPDLEVLYRQVLNHVHSTMAKRDPYSMSTLYSYLYFKEAELNKIVTVIESIRYSIDVNDIIAYIEQH